MVLMITCIFVCLMVIKATFNNIQLYRDGGGNRRTFDNHWQTLYLIMLYTLP